MAPFFAGIVKDLQKNGEMSFLNRYVERLAGIEQNPARANSEGLIIKESGWIVRGNEDLRKDSIVLK